MHNNNWNDQMHSDSESFVLWLQIISLESFSYVSIDIEICSVHVVITIIKILWEMKVIIVCELYAVIVEINNLWIKNTSL